MDLVVDTSAIVAVIGNEAEKDAMIRATAGMDLVVPASVPGEIGNAFSAMLKRGRITLEQAKQALVAYRRIPLRLVDVELDRSLELSAEYNIYAYEAYVIACAERQRCPLLALDRGLLHVARQAGVSLLEMEP